MVQLIKRNIPIQAFERLAHIIKVSPENSKFGLSSRQIPTETEFESCFRRWPQHIIPDMSSCKKNKIPCAVTLKYNNKRRRMCTCRLDRLFTSLSRNQAVVVLRQTYNTVATRNSFIVMLIQGDKYDGLFTLQGTGTGKGNRTGTIGNKGPWSLSLSQTSVNFSA